MDNTSCILTVIKNEQEYLDEWIKYHLDLGIDHIFIFEDIDSNSHKKICDKYGDKVSLNCIGLVLDDEDRNKATELKLTKKKNPQEIYFPKALIWIKSNYQYDWCFVIDVDEFITPYKPISDVMDEFRDYDGIVIQWKLFGANGQIYKPNYDGRGVLDVYTKESNYAGHSVLEWTTKTCYNLHAFKETYFKNNHQPSDECHWCRTDFSNIRTKIVYDKIYIKHYITKSWEEYISKRKRGYFMGFARTIDMFFRINQDMLPLKQELLDGLNKETLVVLPYKQSGSQGNEIRLALNGWKKFCQFNYRFVVIGEFDESLKEEFPWAEFIHCPTKEKKEGQYNPHLDMQNKFKIVAMRYAQIYDGFIFMTDDKYAIKPFYLKDVTSVFYHSLNFIGNEKCPTSYWNHDKWKTRQLLDKENLPHINYATHHPCYFEFKKLKEIRKKYNMLEESYVFHDVYFNYFKHEEPILDSTIRLGVWNNEIYKNEFQKAVDDPNIKFVCNSVEGWSKELEDDLKKIIDYDVDIIVTEMKHKGQGLGLEYHLVDSCNLNCAGCSHYSSLVDKHIYVPIETLTSEFNLLKSKVGDNLTHLRLLGGEPLMHPQICECLDIIRSLFPRTNISIVTNGLLLEKMPQEFYNICAKTNIRISITDYGFIDLASVINKLKEHGIFASRCKVAKLWDYQRIRLTEGKIDCFTKCKFKKICNNYRNGKIYLCPQIAYIEYFNNFFGKNIKIDETDYISLEDVDSFDDLMEKINSMRPNFCYQYCNNYDNTHPIKGKWEKTKKDINEFCLL